MTERITSYQRSGLTFEVADEGPLDGEVVLLLHGFPQLNTMWREVTPALHAAGYRTIAPNKRGYSHTAMPRGRRAYRITELVGDVVALCGQIGRPVHLVAHDWGAAVGWVAVSRHPELFLSYVAVSVPHVGAFMSALPRGQLLRSWYMGFFNLPWLPERVLSNRAAAQRAFATVGLGGELFEDYWRDFGSDPQRLRGALAAYRGLVFEDPRSLFRKARVPSTLVWSDDDPALGRAGTRLCEDYVEAPYRLEVLPGASHWIPQERPEELTRIVLERVSSST